MRFLQEIAREFIGDDCPRLAAALSYYTVFALPPLLVLVLVLTGAVADSAALRMRVAEQVRVLAGPVAARQVGIIVNEVGTPRGSVLQTLGGIAALLFGATGAFAQLQGALNAVWGVEPDPARGGVRNFLVKRLISFGMVLAVAFLLLASLVSSALLSRFGDTLGAWLGNDLSSVALRAIDLGASAVVLSLLFGALFRTLPDAIIRWREVAVGAVVTTAAFLLGRYAIGLYLGTTNPASAYGAAGSLAVILIWVYLTSMILLLGAEFTQVWARRHGHPIRPEPGAVRVEVRRYRSGEEPA